MHSDGRITLLKMGGLLLDCVQETYTVPLKGPLCTNASLQDIAPKGSHECNPCGIEGSPPTEKEPHAQQHLADPADKVAVAQPRHDAGVRERHVVDRLGGQHPQSGRKPQQGGQLATLACICSKLRWPVAESYGPRRSRDRLLPPAHPWLAGGHHMCMCIHMCIHMPMYMKDRMHVRMHVYVGIGVGT